MHRIATPSRSATALLAALVCAASGARAQAPPPRAIVIVLDGARADTFHRLLAAGKLPHIDRHVARRGLRVDDCVTVFPSTTGPAYAPFVTGLFPERSALPGIRWYDRQSGRTTVYAGRDFQKINDDLTRDWKTIYELVGGPTLSVFGMVDRGVTRRAMPIVSLAWNKLTGGPLAIDRSLFSTFMKEALGAREVPRFAFLSLHGPDSVGHARGVEHPDYTATIVQADGFVGELAARLEERGLYDSTYLVLTSDHGQSSASQRMSLAQSLSDKHRLNVRDALARMTAGFNAFAGSHRKEHDVHLEVSGNACVQAYLCPKDTDPGERVAHPATREFPARSGRRVDVEKALLSAPAVELVISRQGAGRYRIASTAGAAEVTREGGLFSYRVLEGQDPLGYTADPVVAPLVGGARSTADQWLAATARGAFPDAVVQVAQLLECPRAGDLVVSARPGWEPWTEGQAGVHGGLRREHMCVPLLVGGPGVRVGTVPHARTVDVFPTLLTMLGIEVPAGIDGKPLEWRASAPR